MSAFDDEKGRAQIVATMLVRAGFHTNPIKAILANAHWESRVDPTAWEVPGDPSRGVGIWQWTPGTKVPGLLERSHGYDPDYNYQFQVNALVNNVAGQYYTAYYTETWEEFKTLDNDPGYLTIVFMKNFERPRDTPDRWNQQEPYGVYNGSTGEMIEAFNLDYGGGTGGGGGGGTPVQVFRWPFSTPMTINQGPWEPGGDHNDDNATDWGPVPGMTIQNILAPYDGYLTNPDPGWESGNALLFHSKYKVMFADGSISYATIFLVHDEAPLPTGEYKRGDVIYHTGLAGFATGRHVHMEIFRSNQNHEVFFFGTRPESNQFGILSGGMYTNAGDGRIDPEFSRNTIHSGIAGPYRSRQFWIDGGAMSPSNAINATAEQKASISDIGWSETLFANDLRVTNYNDTNDPGGGGTPTPVDPDPPRKITDESISILNDIFHGAPNPHPEWFGR